jgi:glycyl-tRNA synthetase beta chain
VSAATTDLLIELGCEELPPKALAKLGRALHGELAKRLLNDAELRDAATHSEAFWSPRRLAVRITALRAIQPERTIDRLGPAVAQAFGADGKPTKAAEGFARSCGVALEQLGQKDGKLHFRTTLPGQPLAALVPDALRAALDALPIPKRMRWGAGDALFVRPVHWLVALAGDKVIEMELMGLWSGRESRGHRFHHPQPVAIATPAAYFDTLKKNKVWLDGDAMTTGTIRDEVVRQVGELAAKAGGSYGPEALQGISALHRDADLVVEVAALCEWPVAMLGDFEPRFLELPPEVLELTLEHHQRYFPLRARSSGTLLPHFVFVANVASTAPAVIKRGNERVIVPRLSDAMFFWQQDRKEKLVDRALGLGAVVFQKELGSYADKARRVAALAGSIATQIGADPAAARHAASIAKADLLSSLVGEFPELQGILGWHLATADGEPADVAVAIAEQYRPRFAGDLLPITPVGKALALAEKLDTLAGIFAIGQKPTGDKDPFALRRLALGAMRIVIEGKLDLDLKALIAEALAGQTAAKATDATLGTELYLFLMERLRAWYEDAGRRADVFNAVLARAPSRPLDFDARMKAVEAFLGLPEAAALAAANKRCSNILRQSGHVPTGGAATTTIDAALLTEPGEKALHEALTGGEIAWVEGLLEQGAYESALRRLASLKAPVDQFFDGVMVMAEDPAVRANRLALLARLQGLFLHVADLAELQVE